MVGFDLCWLISVRGNRIRESRGKEREREGGREGGGGEREGERERERERENRIRESRGKEREREREREREGVIFITALCHSVYSNYSLSPIIRSVHIMSSNQIQG